MEKIRIAYIISSLAKQGPVTVLYDIVSNLDFNKFDVTVITLKKEEEHNIAAKFNELPIRNIQLVSKNKFNLLYYYRKIRDIIKNEKIDLIHSHCIRSLILAVFLKKRTKTFHTIHIYPGIQAIAKEGKLFGRLSSFITKLCIKRIHYPIACSFSVAETLKKKDNIIVGFITNGISLLSFDNENKSYIRNKLGLNPKLIYFISVGRFSPEKNFETLVEAFKKSNIPNAKLIVLGEGKTFEKVNKISNDNIIFPGFKNNVTDYLIASDFYISTSLTEGMPLSVLEAMSCGLPLLLSNISAHKEIFNHSKNKNIGLKFSPTNVSEIAESIELITTYDYRKLQENTKFVFDNYFTSSRMSKEYQDLYISKIKQ